MSETADRVPGTAPLEELSGAQMRGRHRRRAGGYAARARRQAAGLPAGDIAEDGLREELAGTAGSGPAGCWRRAAMVPGAQAGIPGHHDPVNRRVRQAQVRGDSREVAAGQSAGVRWAIGVRASDAGTFRISMTRAYQGATATSGVTASPLRGGQLVSMWISRDPGIPRVLLVWAAPDVRHATVVMASGDRHDVALSPVIEDFSLRFGAGPLPTGDPPASIEIAAWRRGTQIIELWRPPRRSR